MIKKYALVPLYCRNSTCTSILGFRHQYASPPAKGAYCYWCAARMADIATHLNLTEHTTVRELAKMRTQRPQTNCTNFVWTFVKRVFK